MPDVNSVADKSLLLRLKLGDEDAFRQIFTRWREPLVWFVYHIIGSWEDAEDICQDTFAILWQKCDTIDPEKRINTFIFLIAKQVTLKYIRKNKHTDDFHVDTEPDGNSDPSPEEIMQSQEMELLIKCALCKLPPRTAEIFDLYFTEGLSYEQIADRLDINTANVKAKIHQARTKIKDILAAVMVLLMM